ncbi:MAG: TraB/GumN family protein [Spirochaetales bacterium]|nr:TraB/GumN family protein [Spirochaetales bacterium]
MSGEDSITRLEIGGREIILVGTAHVSKESTDQVEQVIRDESPDTVCVEIDKTRYRSISEGQSWSGLNVYEVLKQRKGFLLMANLVLASFQRRLGMNIGAAPGEEMRRAVVVCEELGIPFVFADREIHVTLRRAWKKTGFWGKNKMLAALLSSVFTKEKLSAEEIENLKEKSAVQDMMEELADYLPSVKKVLIDERDTYLAAKIFESNGKKIIAIIGAGHVRGIVQRLESFDTGAVAPDVTDIEAVPPPTRFSKIVPWLVPAVVLGIIATGFLRSGWKEGLEMLWLWVLVNGTLSAVGALLALAHPLTIVLSFAAAPITSLNPTIGVGIVTGLLEAVLRKPRVRDFESLLDDITSLKGFYRNRLTHILIVFFLSSLGSAIGTFIGIPWLTSLLA